MQVVPPARLSWRTFVLARLRQSGRRVRVAAGAVAVLAIVALGWKYVTREIVPADVARRLRVEQPNRYAAAFSKNGRYLAVGSSSGKVDFWSTEKWEQPQTAPLTQQPITSLLATSDGHLLAGSYGGRVLVWQWKTMAARMISPLPGIPTALAAFPSGRELAIGLADGRLWRLNTVDGTSRLVPLGHSGAVTGLAITTDGNAIASVGSDATLRITYDRNDVKPIARNDHRAPIAGIAISGDRAVTADWGGEVRTWNTRDWSVVHVETLPAAKSSGKSPPASDTSAATDSCSHVAMTGEYAAVGTWGGKVALFRPGNGELERAIECGYAIQALAISADSRWLATAGAGSFVDIRELPAPK